MDAPQSPTAATVADGGYPDSHLSSRSGGSIRRQAAVLLIPLGALFAWFGYLWAVSGVLPATEKYANGRLKSVGYVKRDGWRTYHRHGHWVTYHADGTKASEGVYQLGEKTPPWTYWDEQGREIRN